MPRISERAKVLESVEDAAVFASCVYLLASDEEEEEEEDEEAEDEEEEDIRELLEIHEMITSCRYLSRKASAGRVNIDILDTYIHEYPKTAFLALFRMHKESFWKLVEILTLVGGDKYWDLRATMQGRNPRPIYQQIAVALYMLGGGGTGERARIALNIGHGTIWQYTWRTTELLYRLAPQYIHWPQQRTRVNNAEADSDERGIFGQCIGFLDGSSITLRYKPMVDPEAYFSRKKIYGFNLQAICNWEGQFIWTSMKYPASVQDSKAWKATAMYEAIESYFQPDEYILADKAYALERHIITPYKSPAATLPINVIFNYELSKPRVKIEHAFGILKVRWPTIYDIPIRIGMDEKKGHRKVHYWTMACLVLHNLLHTMRDDETWLKAEMDRQVTDSNNDIDENREHEPYTQAQRMGNIRRDELRALLQGQE